MKRNHVWRLPSISTVVGLGYKIYEPLLKSVLFFDQPNGLNIEQQSVEGMVFASSTATKPLHQNHAENDVFFFFIRESHIEYWSPHITYSGIGYLIQEYSTKTIVVDKDNKHHMFVLLAL